ncbi:hypothetical protein AYJ00_04750 [Shewanella algae]|uniref:HNH endonuclease n=1 Tax=Shewanella algae TaxID=38313 RepID=UPI0011839667|nr:HNH endonuclease signature motif containing protein [Shewanella algae]TVL55353.1 hypothetical protein AYJ00_04750 [Shewanella algae]
MEFAPNNIDYSGSEQFERDWKQASKQIFEHVRPLFEPYAGKLRCSPDLKDKAAWLKFENPHPEVHLLAVCFSRVCTNSVLDIRVWFRQEQRGAYDLLSQAEPFIFNETPLIKSVGMNPRTSWASQLRDKDLDVVGIQYGYRQGYFADETSIAEGIASLLQDFAQYLLRVLEGQCEQTAVPDTTEALEEAAIVVEAGATAKRLQWIADRQGQPAFRQKLLEAYEGCCCLSGTAVPEALEAAHIIPFSERRANDICNGLLLRADLHTLFDLGLINICPDTRTVEVAEMLRETEYGKLAGKRLHEPLSPDARPSADALRWRTRHIWNSEGM